MEKLYKALLFDLDDTILSFTKAEEYALKKLFLYYNIEINEERINLYKEINLKYWKKLERGEITREDLLKSRFEEFFEVINYPLDFDKAYQANDIYFSYLTSKIFYVKDAISSLAILKEKYKIYIITNGIKKVQEKRIRLAKKLHLLYDDIFVSEEVGYPKPSKEYMDYVINKIGVKKDEILIIGDSLSSDMMLGINNNVDTCWFNPQNGKTDLNITYNVRTYKEILDILSNSHS